MLIGQTIGPFLVESELGSGAMGTVYKARFTKESGRVVPVALKVISLGLLGNEGAMARFEREASILKQLRHPHIVRLLATGRYRQTPFIAMEFVDGESLEKTIARRSRLDWLEVISYSKQLCDALQHAHEKGIVHRDLKPSNLMVTSDGTLKLTDFGIAKDTDVTALTGANSTIGTAAYMSPEQCRGDKTLGPKSDLYSLGICIYELLTGIKPFAAESTVDLFLKHVNETPVRPRRLVAEIPVWLDNLVMFCLEKNKESRPLDAATIGRMLGEIEEKVRTNQSVGEEVANARRIDRPVGKVADADKQAALDLRSSSGKKRKKKPQHEAKPPWKLMVLAVVPVILLLIYAGYSFLPARKPPETAEAAFERLLANSGTPEERRSAAEDYLTRFPTSSHANDARTLIRTTIIDRTESALQKRYGSQLKKNSEGFNEEAYRLAIQALDAEAKGQLSIAADLWKQSLSHCPPGPTDGSMPSEADTLSVSLGWVASRRMQVITRDISAMAKRIQAKIVEDNIYELDPPYNSADLDSLAYQAYRLQQIGDRAKAKLVWEQLASAAQGDAANLAYTLLARKQVLENTTATEQTSTDRAALVAKRLADHETALLTSTNPADAKRTLRNTCRAVISMYAEETDPEFVTLVEKARQLLISHAKT